MICTLVDVEKRQQETPETFWIPSKEDRESLQPADHAKLIFNTERMWVEVGQLTETGYVGKLKNNPVLCDMVHGETVWFEAKHIMEIEKAGESKITDGNEETNIRYVDLNQNAAKILH